MCCISSTRNNFYCCATGWSWKVKNAEHQPKTCNKTMLRDKLSVFVSRILPALLRLGCLFVPGKCIDYKEEPRGSPLWPRCVSLVMHVNFLLNVTGPVSSIAANATSRRNSRTKGLRSRQHLYKVIYGLCWSINFVSYTPTVASSLKKLLALSPVVIKSTSRLCFVLLDKWIKTDFLYGCMYYFFLHKIEDRNI